MCENTKYTTEPDVVKRQAYYLRRQAVVKQYQDVKVIDLQCIYEIQGEETICDADKQQVTIESETYEWLTGAI